MAPDLRRLQHNAQDADGYRGQILRYIDPAIGDMSLQSPTPQHVQGLYSALLERGLSGSTVLHVHRLIRQALSHAVKWRLCIRNVVDATTPPRPQRRQSRTWDVDTIHRFLKAANGSLNKDFYHLAVLTGMRKSELAGLKWENVDLTRGNLSVVTTLQRIDGRGLVEVQPKTGRSRRSIALSPDAISLLHQVRGRKIEQRLALGDVWYDTPYVFTQANGKPVYPDEITKEFARIVRSAALPAMTLHGLRHAHATLLLTAGIRPKVVGERLGHSNIAVTMDTYSHVLSGLQEQAALAIDERLGQRASGVS